MDISGNKGFYIIILIFAALVAGIIAILYVNSQKKQKVFEDAIGELKEEALKYIKLKAEPPFSEYEDVTNQPTEEQPVEEVTAEEVVETEEAPETLGTDHFSVPAETEISDTVDETKVQIDISEKTNPDNTVLNFKQPDFVKDYVQAPTNEKLPIKTGEEKAEVITELQSKVEPQKVKPVAKPAPAKPKTKATPAKKKDSVKPAPTAQKQETPTTQTA